MTTIQELAAPWLAPISESEPAGHLADHEPAYERVLAEVSKLDAVGGGEVDWQVVVDSGNEVLQTLSKDIRIACRVTYGLRRTKGLAGCVRGLALLAELTDQYWEGLFPSMRRLRARVGTINWLIEHLEKDLKLYQAEASEREAVNQLAEVVQHLDTVLKNRFGERAPPLQPLQRAVERLQLLSPQTPAGLQPSLPESDTPSIAATVPSAPLSEVPKAPSETAQPTQDPPTFAEPDQPEEELKEEPNQSDLVSAWLQPICADQPAGADAKYEEAFEWVTTEIETLSSITGGEVDWPKVVKAAGGVLISTSKDLTMASYMAAGWLEADGLAGLNRGVILIAQLCDRFWEDMFPAMRRLRARSGILAWLLERWKAMLQDYMPSEADHEPVAMLQEAAGQLAQILQEKFAGDGPPMHVLVRAAERLQLSLPEPSKEPAPAPESAPAEQAPAEQAPTPQEPTPQEPTPQALATQPATPAPTPQAPATQAAFTQEAPASFKPSEDVTEYLRSVGVSLTDAARALRGNDSTNPMAYRLLRQGTWLQLASMPPADAKGQTIIPPYRPSFKKTLEDMAAHSAWLGALEESESYLSRYPFWFDLQRHSATALAALGPQYAKARRALIGAFRHFLDDMPNATSMSFADSTPFADTETRNWIDQEVLVSSSVGTAASSANEETASILNEASELLQSNSPADAIKFLQAASENADSRRKRLRLRLVLAKTCISAGQVTLAKAVYEDLHQEAVARGLAQWDPPLAIEVLQGYLMAVQTLLRGGKDVGNTAELLFEQLCILDPALAISLGE